jgi:hypothetical protein
MCNQTEMWLEISDYDRRASKGEVHVRGIAHDPRSCPKCLKDARKGTKKAKAK